MSRAIWRKGRGMIRNDGSVSLCFALSASYFELKKNEETFSGSLLRLLRCGCVCVCMCIYICVCGSHVSGGPCKKLMGCLEKMFEINVRLLRGPGAGCLCVPVCEKKTFACPG